MENLKVNLKEQGYDIQNIPLVVQYNKRDLPNISTVEELRGILNPNGLSEFEAIATIGGGVFETLKSIAKLVLLELKKGR